MAVAVREIHIANPARKAGSMTLKQKLHFGTKRQRAAAKAAMRAKRSRPKAKHRKLTTVKRANPVRRQKRNISAPKRANPKHAHRAKARKRRTRRKSNPGAIYALVNPATKGRKNVAKTRKRRQRRHTAAGSTRRHHRRRNPGGRRHHRRRNPSTLGGPKEWLSLGGGAVIGGLGATSLPQMVLGASNTGAMGYVGTIAATGILATLGHMVMKGNKALTMGIIAGGTGALIRRVIGDYSLAGQYTSAIAGVSGLGDYLASDFLTPQTLTNGLQNANLTVPSWGRQVAAPVAVSVAGPGMGNIYGRPLY